MPAARAVLPMLIFFGVISVCPGVVHAGSCHGKSGLERIAARLHGRIEDFTHNHGVDRRLCSEALCQKRDLYVYLPPGYRSDRSYPVMIWLHGFGQDEIAFLEQVVEKLDRAIVCGELPPLIVAAPDGSLTGEPSLLTAGSFFINSKAGRFEDYLMQDVWPFLQSHYPIRPESDAHVIAGVSMGGGAAYNLGIKHREHFRSIIGIFPPVNLRWIDCHSRYRSDFDPCCWSWRTDFSRKNEIVARFFGIVVIRLKNITDPLFDAGPNTAARVALDNPIEQIDRTGLQPGEVGMYIAYGGKDQFNIDAQVESFLYKARSKGITVDVGYCPRGKHDLETANRLLPGILEWLAPRLERFRGSP